MEYHKKLPIIEIKLILLLKIRVKLFIVYYLKTDKQTKRINSSLE